MYFYVKNFFFFIYLLLLLLLLKFWDFMIYLFKFMFLFMILMIPSLFYGNLMDYFMMDNLSYSMILLSIWISGLMILASESINFNKFFNFIFIFMILFMLMLLILTFSVNNLFLFYFFFESSLIPVFILILGWGYQPDRIQAGMYLLFYTLFASLPMLVGIFFLSDKIKVLNYFMLNFSFNYLFLYLCMVFAFLVKMPMFLVHLWLPKAHVEASISGSMILAGVLLKLGGYGLIRVMNLFIYMNYYLSIFWISVSLIGGILVSLICLRQIDMKSLIAYSSVVHMGMVLGGFFNLTFWGVNMCYYMMIAHGLCSSGLFCLANISYERMLSRSLMINKGLLNFMPSMSLWWFLLCSSNMSAPFSLNLLSEIGLINSMVYWSWFTMFLLMLLCFFSAMYSLYLFSLSQHGSLFSSIFCYSNNMFREYMLVSLHWFPLNFLFIKMSLLMI